MATLGPLVRQVQTWWAKQHANCQQIPDPLGRPFASPPMSPG